MSYNNEDLQTFLIQAQLIHEKVKALAQNRMSSQEFDHLEKARAEDKRKRQQAQKRREREAFEKKRQGRQGKGITKDFQNFCKFCYREYQLPTPLCLRCNRNTITLKERQLQLEVMVGEYKHKKKRREERKMKWQMWQKTKAMLWKKTSNNYDKWDYFVSDSQEQPEKQPIVPKDDPNFKALERDMQQRKAMRMKDTKKAKELKQKGNAFMKQGKYQQAKNMYTLALEHIKDIKSIYTNRALAFIKLGKFKKAVKDCTDVIDYMQLFEKVEQNRDLVFKAYLRRASAKKEMKDYKEALDDAKKALTFYPTDKSAEILRKQIQGFIEHSEKVQKLLRQSNKNPESEKKKVEEQKPEQQQQKKIEEDASLNPQPEQPLFKQSDIVKQLAEASIQQQRKEQETKKTEKDELLDNKSKTNSDQKNQTKINHFTNQIQEIKYRLQNLSQQNINALFLLMRQKNELVNIFISAKGIQKCLSQMLSSEECRKEGYLISMCLRGDAVGEKQVWDFGVQKIYKRVLEILSNSNQLHFGKYLMLQDIFEILIPLSLHEKYRIMLNQSNQTYQFLQKIFSQLITKHKKQPDLLSSVLIYMGNLCSGDSKLRDVYINDQRFNIIVNSLYEKVILRKTLNRNHLNLKKNVYNLLANMAINTNHRFKLLKSFSQKQLSSENQGSRWGQIVKELRFYQKSNQNFTQYTMSLLSLFTNVTLGTSSNIEGLAQCINERFLSNPASFDLQIVNRALLTASRIKYQNNSLFKQMLKNFSLHLETFKKKKNDRSLMQHVVRLLNIIYSPIEGQNKFDYPIQGNLLKQLKQYISSLQYGEILFCNTCNLFSVLLDTKTAYGAKFYSQLLGNIKFLIDVVKDKVGNWRKNSATLLAKLSLNAECKKQLQKNHGMEVLKSIAQFVK